MNIKLKYGHSCMNFSLPGKNIIRTLKTPALKKIKNPAAEIRRALLSPGGSPSLKQLITGKKPKKVVVILEDITRPNPDYPLILSLLLGELSSAGINSPEFVIGYGTHRKMSAAETEKLYGKSLLNYKITHHDCDNAKELKYAGTLSTGNRLMINRSVAESDFIITTGNIEPHSFAGFTGGAKSILPGVSSRETITRNHAKVTKEHVSPGELAGNPLHREIFETLDFVNVAFAINFIRNENNEIVKIFSGDIRKTFKKGAAFAKKMFTVKIRKPADVAIVSCGGYPKDINLYHAQKALTLASGAVSDGGTLILLADCLDGMGQPLFVNWLKHHSLKQILDKKEKEIEVEGHRAYLTAKILNRIEILVVTSLSRENLESLKFKWAPDINTAIKYVIDKHGKDFGAYLIPGGGNTIPVSARLK